MSHITYAGKTSWKHDIQEIPKISDAVVEYVASLLAAVPAVEGIDEEYDKNLLKLNQMLTDVQNYARSISEESVVMAKRAPDIATGNDPIVEIDGIRYSRWEAKILEMFSTIDQQNRIIGTLLGWAETVDLKTELAELTMLNLKLSQRLRNLYMYPTVNSADGRSEKKISNDK